MKFMQLIFLIGKLEQIIPVRQKILAINHQAKLKMLEIKGDH